MSAEIVKLKPATAKKNPATKPSRRIEEDACEHMAQYINSMKGSTEAARHLDNVIDCLREGGYIE